MLKEKQQNLLKKQHNRILYKQNMYEKISLIGEGTFGKMQVVHKRSNIIFALKEVIQDQRFVNRELSIVALMKYSNIIELKGYFFTIASGLYKLHMIMDYMNSNLDTLLKNQKTIKKPLSLEKRKIIAFQLFKGLYYLEINRICHRDIKPSNILVDSETLQIKICDFGSAKIIQEKGNNVPYIGSRYYRAPQLLFNSTSYGCEIDMWSAGCIIVELMTLDPIFPGDSSIEQLIEIVKIIGTPSAEQMNQFCQCNDEFHFPKVTAANWNRAFNNYNPSQQQIDLINMMLTYDVKNRIKPLDALKHRFFEDLGHYQQGKKIKNLLNFQQLKNQENIEMINQLQELFDSYNIKQNPLKSEDSLSTSNDSKKN